MSLWRALSPQDPRLRYELVQRVGAGTYGDVYKVPDAWARSRGGGGGGSDAWTPSWGEVGRPGSLQCWG